MNSSGFYALTFRFSTDFSNSEWIQFTLSRSKGSRISRLERSEQTLVNCGYTLLATVFIL